MAMKVTDSSAGPGYIPEKTILETLEVEVNSPPFELQGELIEPDPVRPLHYTSAEHEAIEVIEDWQLNFNLGNTIKYISRAGKKTKTSYLEDLQKAAFYLNREIERHRR